MSKIPPISVTHKNQNAMVCRSAWRTACYGLLWSAAVCGTPLAMVSPLKAGRSRQSDLAFSITLVTSDRRPPRASAGPSLLAGGALVLKFYRNIESSIVFKKQ